MLVMRLRVYLCEIIKIYVRLPKFLRELLLRKEEKMITRDTILKATKHPPLQIYVKTLDEWSSNHSNGHYLPHSNSCGCHSWFQQHKINLLYGARDNDRRKLYLTDTHIRILSNMMCKELHPSLKVDPKTYRVTINTGDGTLNWMAMNLVRYGMEAPHTLLMILRNYQITGNFELSVFIAEFYTQCFGKYGYRSPVFLQGNLRHGDNTKFLALWRTVNKDYVKPYGFYNQLTSQWETKELLCNKPFCGVALNTEPVLRYLLGEKAVSAKGKRHYSEYGSVAATCDSVACKKWSAAELNAQLAPRRIKQLIEILRSIDGLAYAEAMYTIHFGEPPAKGVYRFKAIPKDSIETPVDFDGNEEDNEDAELDVPYDEVDYYDEDDDEW